MPARCAREPNASQALGALALLTLLLVLPACAVQETRPAAPDHPLLARAEQALLKGEDDEALRCYRAYREGFRPSPLESECHCWEGTILLKKGEVREAERSFRAAAARPRSPFVESMAWIGIGDCAFVADDYRGAASAYQRALDLAVPDARNDYAIYRLGVARQRLGQWDAGASCYRTLVAGYKKSPLVVRAEQRLRAPDRSLHFQVGAFQAEDSARKLEVYLHQKGFLAKTVNALYGKAPYLVWVGDYPSFEAARAALPEVKRLCGGEVLLVP